MLGYTESLKCNETNSYMTHKGNLLLWPVKYMIGWWIFSSTSPFGQ